MVDALRRLEGNAKFPLRINGWVEAGAVTMIGNKVPMVSVERTLTLLASIPVHELEDGIDFEAWNSAQSYCPKYRRSDVIRDILSGTIRTSSVPETSRIGLAALHISSSDLLRNAKANLPKSILQIENDLFCQASKISDLLRKLWPGATVVDFVSLPTVRCNFVVRRYRGREYRRRLYIVVDAVAAMTEVHGAR